MRPVFRPLLLFLVAFTLAGLILGQATESTLRGTVTDASGAVIPGVDLTVTNVRTNVVVRRLVSDAYGNYEVPDIPLGTYRVTAELPGFKMGVVDDVRLESAETRRINIVLQILSFQALTPLDDSSSPVAPNR